MAWQDRLREAAYTPPSGVRLTFQYEDVSRETNKRTAGFEFAEVDGAYVQDNGYGARKYPLRCFFSGPSHDIEATTFELALLERGPGRLEHPFYGAFDVVPFGQITRRDDLKSAANQSIIDVTFWTTLPSLYPSGEIDTENELVAALDAFDLASTEEFAEATDLSSATARVATKATTLSLLKLVSGALTTMSEAVLSVDRAFRDAQRAVNYGIDVLVGQPLALAQQVANLIKAPALARVGIDSRLEGYRALADRIFGSQSVTSDDITIESTRLRLSNSFHTADLFVSHAVAGSIRAALEHDYLSRAEALTVAETLLTLFDDLTAWREEQFTALGEVDRGGSYQAMLHAVCAAASHLIQVSFTLATERFVVLDRARTIIDLAAELFGSIDDRLDELIHQNQLTGADILELPAGQTIAYYR